MSKVLHTASIPLLALSLGGCSWLGAHPGPSYPENQATRDLAVPPDLSAPKTSSTYSVPSGQGLGPEQSTAAPTAAAPATSPTASAPSVAAVPQAGVLPATPGIRLVSQGGHQWLSVQAAPGVVWPHVVAYFKAQGFKLEEADAKTGVIRTDWKGDRAGLPKGLTARLFNSLYDSGKRERFVARLVSHQDGAGTLVYLSYQGAIEENIGSGAMHWQWAKPDPGKEATALQALKNYLAAHIPAGQLSAARPDEVAPESTVAPIMPAVTAAPMAKTAGATTVSHTQPFDYRIMNVNQQPVMRSALPYATAWPQIGTALGRADFKITQADEAKGLYHVTYQGQDHGSALGNLLGADAVMSMGNKFIIAVRHHDKGVQVEVDNPMMLPVETDGAQGILELIRGGMVGPHRRAAAAEAVSAKQRAETAEAQQALQQAEASAGGKRATYRLASESGEPVLETHAPYGLVWPQVGLALLHSDFVIESKDSAKGTYEVVYNGKSQGGGGNFVSNLFDGGPVLIKGVRFRIYVQQVDKHDIWVHAQNPMGLPMPAHGARGVLKAIEPKLG
ncbi:outer membrane protein assembly factor BamC [Acidihalobacter prosperus]|uniref:outer membrane protein assembly factor BamC n=1 Tax=Acidihalobacter prosperus TaxID=160660 RepID=UPI0007EE698D|nr:outer membrane protein assembly factor BamC [Acidihalobacter prosperus]